MSVLKAGDFAVVRTTGEPVFVLETRELGDGKIVLPGEETPEDSNFTTQAKVRRPISSRNGIMHVTEFFYVEELETENASAKRRYQNALELQAELAEPNVEELPELLESLN